MGCHSNYSARCCYSAGMAYHRLTVKVAKTQCRAHGRKAWTHPPSRAGSRRETSGPGLRVTRPKLAVVGERDLYISDLYKSQNIHLLWTLQLMGWRSFG